MIMTSKRKLTSGVAILCALMILIGIFPINLFSGKKAEAASITLESRYVYLDISNFTVEWENNDIYMFVDTWGDLQKGEKISGTNVVRWDKSGWSNTGHNFGFSCFYNWDNIKAGNYRRTTMTSINLSDAGAKYFYWDGSSTTTIDSKTVYSISVSDTPILRSLAGKTINFKDMTGKLTNVTAVFTGDGIETNTKSVTSNKVTIPADVDNKAYTTVEFKSGSKSLGKYNLFGTASSGVEAVSYDESSCTTFYYGVTEKLSDNSVVSYWGGAPSTASGSINKKLYLDNIAFNTTSGSAPTITVNGSTANFTKDSDDNNVYSYTVSSATQQTILSVTYNNVRYNFLWNDLSKNKLIVKNNIANVSDTYSKVNRIYFDATLSKLDYTGTDGKNGSPIPATGGVRYYITGSGKSAQRGTMTKATKYTRDNNTWSDVYYLDLPEGYTKVVFSNYDFTGSNYSWTGDCTDELTIPTDLSNPCFYADTSDKTIYESYEGNRRGGYWDEVYTIRDAESGKDSTVVDIKESSFSAAKKAYGSTEVNYVNSTFYDYYTDYELNGSNRDDYDVANGGSQRNWVTFRQFDQALSDLYEKNNVSIPIYTGHFQPSISGWGTRFEDIAGTLDLYGYSNYNNFFSTNNSSIDINNNNNGNMYDSAAWGLVKNTLDNGNLKTSDGKVNLPHFDEDFLLGNNSKNTKLANIYNNVAFPFTKSKVDGVDYWVFDASKTTLAMRKDNDSSSSGNYYLQDVGNQGWSINVNSSSDSKSVYGFFPFNETSTTTHANTYNYGFGTKLEFKFRLTEDGKVLASDGTEKDIQFQFSGDDDVWVFIDGKLALDVGGAHGKVTGTINFGGESATKTSTVSRVKASAGSSTSGDNVTSTFTLEGSNTDEHTLVMYYMERGMWESNMRIQFNFPDENQLEVEKLVDTTDVNEMFKDMFNNKSLFTFDIQNLATHYGPKSVSTTETKPVTFASDCSGNISTKSGSQTTATKQSSKDGQSNVFFYQASSASSSDYQKYTESRMATFNADANKTIDISTMDYLSFKMYTTASYTVPNRTIYIRLTDANGKVLNGYLTSSTLYGTPSISSGKWHTIKVIFRNLSGITSRSNDSDFDYTKLASISFENTDKIEIWLDDIIFQPTTSVSVSTGFQTEQKDIPDYNSATSGKLENANGAQYTSSKDNKTYSVSDGQFVLQNKESITFYNQFRNGSYIALKEDLTEEQKELFDTKWTIYEDNVAVSGLKDKTTLYIDDGRTEAKGTTSQQTNNKYNGNKPSDPTIVFKSYSNDSNNPKLKVVYNNKVKTTNLTITKQKSSTSTDLTGTYEFYVVFTNVGGISLGTVTSQKYSLKVGESATITGIPVGTDYTIHELTPTEADVSLDKVLSNGTEIGFGNDSITVDGTTYQTNSVNGSAGITAGGITAGQTYVFQNAKKPTINLTLKKVWSDVPEGITTPINVNVKLLRSSDGTTWSQVSDAYNNIMLDNIDGNDWKKTINGLDEYTDNTKSTKWIYKLVELDSSGNELAEGNRYLDTYVVSYGAVTSDTNKELTVTNSYRVQDIIMPETGGEGGSPNEFNFVLFGAIAIALAGGLLLLNKKYAFMHKEKSSKEVR